MRDDNGIADIVEACAGCERSGAELERDAARERNHRAMKQNTRCPRTPLILSYDQELPARLLAPNMPNGKPKSAQLSPPMKIGGSIEASACRVRSLSSSASPPMKIGGSVEAVLRRPRARYWSQVSADHIRRLRWSGRPRRRLRLPHVGQTAGAARRLVNEWQLRASRAGGHARRSAFQSRRTAAGRIRLRPGQRRAGARVTTGHPSPARSRSPR